MVGIGIYRSIALHLNALFPALISVKGYFNGQIPRGFISYVKDSFVYIKKERPKLVLNSNGDIIFPVLQIVTMQQGTFLATISGRICGLLEKFMNQK